MLLLGIDVGTCLVKAYIVNAENQAIITSGQYPQGEPPAMPLQTGRAGQSPDIWWQQTQQAPALYNKKCCYHAKNIFSIGLIYQMIGLVFADKGQKILRDSIIFGHLSNLWPEEAFDGGKQEYPENLINRYI